MSHNLEDDPGRGSEDDRLCDGVNVVFLTTPTRSVDPFPLKKKKRWGRGCDSGGASSGVPPFPPSKNKKKEKKKEEREGRTRRTNLYGFRLDCTRLLQFWYHWLLFAHACELHPVSTSHFPERERGRTRRTICMAFALIALDCFSSDTTGCCSLTHVNYILSHTSHFPALGKPKKKEEMRIYTSGAACG